MPGYKVSFTMVGQKELSRTFETLGEAVRDMKDAWVGVVEQVLIPMAKEQFATEGVRVGQWKPLNKEYAEWKARKGFIPRILQRTGLMKESLERSGPGKGMGVFRADEQGMEYGTSVPYAIIHQTGSKKVANHPPQRRILIFWKEDWQKTMRVVRKHVWKNTGVSAQPG